MKRWVCPNGCPGILAPASLRRNDTRRYCLACSAKSPTLVERVVPAALRAKVERSEHRIQARVRSQDRAQRREAARAALAPAYPVAWLMSWVPVIQQLASVPIKLREDRFSIRQRHAPRDRVAVDADGIARAADVATYSSGRAWAGSGHVVVTAGSDRAKALMVLVHEVAHLVKWEGRAHGPKWRSAYAAIASELTGVAIDPTGGTYYDLDDRVTTAIIGAGFDALDRAPASRDGRARIGVEAHDDVPPPDRLPVVVLEVAVTHVR